MSVAAFGKYQVVQKIGQGGFGEVYEGRDPLLNRRVAIKTCSSRDEELRQRFSREAEIAANLRHPNIVTIFDFGHQGDVSYLVQEYLSGEDLDHKIKRREPLEEATIRDYLLQIASGLKYAHSREVVHRDIKPANIRILEDGQVRIMDFGIAKLLTAQTQLTRTGMALGTAAYLPPEQIMGQQVDQRADLFSFGVLAYELIAGERPFSGDSMSTILYAIAHRQPAPVTSHCPQCPSRLAALIETCLAKDPANRYPGFAEVIAELERPAAAMPPVPPVPSHQASGPTSQPGPPAAALSGDAPTIATRPAAKMEGREEKSRGTRKALIALLAAAVLLALGLGIVALGKRRSAARQEQAVAPPPAAVAQETPRPEVPSDPEPQAEPAVAPADATGGETSAPGEPDLAEAPPPPPRESRPRVPPRASTRPPRPEPVAARPTPPKPSPAAEPEPAAEPAAPPVASEAAPPVAAAAPLITAIPFGLQQGRLAPGQPVYADRDFVYQRVPEAYFDLTCLRTLNDFKRIATDIELQVSRDVEVFVGHDRRIKRKPAWLGDFRRTGETLTVREGAKEQDVVVYDVFVRDYPRGTVNLGANTPPRSKKRVSMYTVFVRPR